LQQGVLADYIGRIGEGGSALGIRQQDDLHNRRASFGVEVDTWDGGYGSHDPPNGYGANAGGRRWHTGLDFNETYVSAMTDVDFGATFDNVLVNNEGGAHVSLKYQPNDDDAILETWLSFNDGSLAPTLVSRAVGPRLRGDVVLTLAAANGGATEIFDIDNLSGAEICCEGAAESVSIRSAGGGGDHAATEGDAVTLTADAGGLDGPATYTWSLASGSAALAPAGPSCEVTGTAVGEVVVEVKVSDGVCGNEATAQHTVTFTTPGGRQRPMDMNQDAKLDLSDAVAILGHLFLGAKGPPCGDGTVRDPANIALLDCSGDGAIDLSDPVCLLGFLFLGGRPPRECVDACCECLRIPRCPEVAAQCVAGGGAAVIRAPCQDNPPSPSVAKVTLSSSKGDKSPQDFEGHKAWPIDPTAWPDPGKHLVVFRKDVIDEKLMVTDFQVDLKALLRQEGVPLDKLGLRWKVEGPASGVLEQDPKVPSEARFRSPKVGGVYKLKLEVEASGRPTSEANLVLPLAGAEVKEIVKRDLARADDFAKGVLLKYTRAQILSRLFGWFYVRGDYDGRPGPKDPTLQTNTFILYNQMDSNLKGAVATWFGRPIRVAKLSNFLYAYAIAKLGFSLEYIMTGGVLGTPDGRDTLILYSAGHLLATDSQLKYDSYMPQILDDVWKESSDEKQKHKKLWPNPAPAAEETLHSPLFPDDEE
ncbi:MAG: hypothetical protein HY721_23455, partial [Planctomycetes bacterium]|nr:hypothetical protein [Planctomycetota bacterium]